MKGKLWPSWFEVVLRCSQELVSIDRGKAREDASSVARSVGLLEAEMKLIKAKTMAGSVGLSLVTVLVARNPWPLLCGSPTRCIWVPLGHCILFTLHMSWQILVDYVSPGLFGTLMSRSKTWYTWLSHTGSCTVNQVASVGAGRTLADPGRFGHCEPSRGWATWRQSPPERSEIASKSRFNPFIAHFFNHFNLSLSIDSPALFCLRQKSAARLALWLGSSGEDEIKIIFKSSLSHL